jgi:hypothetical protein
MVRGVKRTNSTSKRSNSGPFRVSELIRMLDEGSITPYGIVTSSHVEEYDCNLPNESQKAAGKWKRMNEVWQLRWQLCTDDGGSGIYSPAEVTSLALRSLTRLVDLHRSLDFRGVPYCPIPAA